MTTTPLLAHAVGHTIIRAVLGDHESGLEIDGNPSWARDYVSDCNAGTSWSAPEIFRFHLSEYVGLFLNQLCITVSGYVGEYVFHEADSLICGTATAWTRSGRVDLFDAYSLCEQYIDTHGKSTEAVLEACMEIVETTLRKYQSVAERLFEILLHERSVTGYRFAALLASIAEENLASLVCERVGMPPCLDFTEEE